MALRASSREETMRGVGASFFGFDGHLIEEEPIPRHVLNGHNEKTLKRLAFRLGHSSFICASS